MKKIALIQSGGWSGTNIQIRQQLEQRFPEYQLDVFDIADLVGHKKHRWLNKLSALWDYRLRPLWDRKWMYTNFTTYLFRAARKQVQQHIAGKGYLFTLQTQSLFDAHVEGTPHFIYTDGPMLINRSLKDFDERRLSQPWLALEKQLFTHAQMTFTMNQFQRQTLIDYYNCSPEKVVSVGAGCNAILASEGTSKDRYTNKHILFVGIDWQRKGGSDLLKAFALVVEVHPDAQLTIIGCSPTTTLRNCRVLGKLPPSQLSFYFEQASIFCLPTHNEPFGIVFVEAFAHRLPVVTTELPTLVDMVHHGVDGLKVEAGNSEQLATALNTLLADPQLCRRMGEAGQKRTAGYFNWKAVGQRIVAGIVASLATLSSLALQDFI